MEIHIDREVLMISVGICTKYEAAWEFSIVGIFECHRLTMNLVLALPACKECVCVCVCVRVRVCLCAYMVVHAHACDSSLEFVCVCVSVAESGRVRECALCRTCMLLYELFNQRTAGGGAWSRCGSLEVYDGADKREDGLTGALPHREQVAVSSCSDRRLGWA